MPTDQSTNPPPGPCQGWADAQLEPAPSSHGVQRTVEWVTSMKECDIKVLTKRINLIKEARHQSTNPPPGPCQGWVDAQLERAPPRTLPMSLGTWLKTCHSFKALKLQDLQPLQELKQLWVVKERPMRAVQTECIDFPLG